MKVGLSLVALVLSTMACPQTGGLSRPLIPYGLWDGGDFRLRTHRKLNRAEAELWARTVLQRRIGSNRSLGGDPQQLVETAVAEPAQLAVRLRSTSQEIRLLALLEVGLRKETSFKSSVMQVAMGDDPTAYWVLRRLDAGKGALIECYRRAKPRSLVRYLSACDLLKFRDLRGVSTVRAMIARPIRLPFETQFLPMGSGEAAYWLICYADGNDLRLLRNDIKVVHRYYFPKLADLRRPNVDRELLKLAGHPQHHIRKWIAVAASRRTDSRAFRAVLEKLRSDPVKDVRETALWALGLREIPRNLGALMNRPSIASR